MPKSAATKRLGGVAKEGKSSGRRDLPVQLTEVVGRAPEEDDHWTIEFNKIL